MVTIPYRTGLKTIKTILHKVCQLVAKFRPLWLTFMTAPQVAVFDNLVVVCNDVVETIDLILDL